jgi:ribonuclease HI
MSLTSDIQIIMYTDGSCIGNPGPGGFCAILTAWKTDQQNTLKLVKYPRIVAGGSPDTTNNIMELMAVIEGLKALTREGVELTVVTDSQYVKNGIESWITGWKKKGWKTSKKEPVKNKELWVELDSIVARHIVTWEWTKGHAGHEWNTKADEIATTQARLHRK